MFKFFFLLHKLSHLFIIINVILIYIIVDVLNKD